MEFTCLKEQLQKSLQLAERHIDRASTIPILQGILLKTDKNTLIIRSTDLNTGFETYISAQIKKEGTMVIPARPSISLISSITGEKIRILSLNDNMNLITKNTTTVIKGYPHEEFPKLPEIKNGEKIVFSIQDLVKQLKSVFFAASQSDIKPEISSILFKGDSNQLIKIAATDSFRLAEKSFKAHYNKPFSFLFPARRASEFIKILESFNGEVEFIFDQQQLCAFHPSFSYFTRLTEGRFPDYEQIIPTTFSTEGIMNRRELIENLKLAGIFSGRMKETHLRIYPNDNLLEISTHDSELGEHASHLSIQVTGENTDMSFNQRYILDGLEPIESEQVILRFSGAGHPLTIQNPQDLSYTYLVMPMKNP